LTGVRSGDSGNPLEPLQNKACEGFQKTTIGEDLKTPIFECQMPSADQATTAHDQKLHHD